MKSRNGREPAAARRAWKSFGKRGIAPDVSLKDTIKGFRAIVDGEYDSLPEQAFYMVGSIEEAVERAKTL